MRVQLKPMKKLSKNLAVVRTFGASVSEELMYTIDDVMTENSMSSQLIVCLFVCRPSRYGIVPGTPLRFTQQARLKHITRIHSNLTYIG